MSQKWIEFKEAPDHKIFNRVSEEDVVAWIVARLDQIRKVTGLPVHHMTLEAWSRDYKDNKYDACWSMHAVDSCVLTHDSVESAVEATAKQLTGEPDKKAAEKRRQAKELLAEAEQLEALAAKPTAA